MGSHAKRPGLEVVIESAIFRARWLLLPIYLGLIVVLALVVIKFGRFLIDLTGVAWRGYPNELVVGILTVIDVVMLANLILMFLFSGYDSFLSHLDVPDEIGRPHWMAKIDMSDMKAKVASSLVVISAIELLKAFLDLGRYSEHELFWRVVIHLVFVGSVLAFTVTDRLQTRG